MSIIKVKPMALAVDLMMGPDVSIIKVKPMALAVDTGIITRSMRWLTAKSRRICVPSQVRLTYHSAFGRILVVVELQEGCLWCQCSTQTCAQTTPTWAGTRALDCAPHTVLAQNACARPHSHTHCEWAMWAMWGHLATTVAPYCACRGVLLHSA